MKVPLEETVKERLTHYGVPFELIQVKRSEGITEFIFQYEGLQTSWAIEDKCIEEPDAFSYLSAKLNKLYIDRETSKIPTLMYR